MGKVVCLGKFILKVTFVALLFTWNFVMNCVGALICAITEG